MASNYTVVPGGGSTPVFETGYFGIFQPAFAYILYCMYSTSVGVIIGNYLKFTSVGVIIGNYLKFTFDVES